MQISRTTGLYCRMLMQYQSCIKSHKLKSILKIDNIMVISLVHHFNDRHFNEIEKWCLPKNVLNKMGLRPNLSDHGPIRKLIKAGMILSKIARAINIFDAYSSNSSSISYKAKDVNVNKRFQIQWVKDVRITTRASGISTVS